MSTYDFARRYLAEPLGVPIAPWVRDLQGIYLGGNEMQWTPRAMLAFGELYQSGGRAGGKPLVSETWVKESLRPRPARTGAATTATAGGAMISAATGPTTPGDMAVSLSF